MNLIYITDAYGVRVRIDKDDLDNTRRQMLPIYNSRGIKIMDQRTYDPRKHSGMTHICRANIPGTPEHAESQKAYNALLAEMEAPAMVPGPGAPQYVMPGIEIPEETQLSLL